MSIKFSAGEVFEMAKNIERNGAGFYRKAADQFDDETAVHLLTELAEMEDDHLKTFIEMKAELSAREVENTVFDPYGESGMYLQAMASEHVFDVKVDPSEALTGTETLEGILKTAIKLEKDSILFYYGMKSVVPDALGKERIEDIIEQEFGHLSILSKKLSELKQ
jgi:rubrerythrin